MWSFHILHSCLFQMCEEDHPGPRSDIGIWRPKQVDSCYHWTWCPFALVQQRLFSHCWSGCHHLAINCSNVLSESVQPHVHSRDAAGWHADSRHIKANYQVVSLCRNSSCLFWVPHNNVSIWSHSNTPWTSGQKQEDASDSSVPIKHFRNESHFICIFAKVFKMQRSWISLSTHFWLYAGWQSLPAYSHSRMPIHSKPPQPRERKQFTFSFHMCSY